MSSAPPSPSFEQPAPLGPRPELPEGVVRPAAPDRGAGLPRWPWWAPLAAFVLTMVGALLGATLIALGAEVAGVDVDTDDLPLGVSLGGVAAQHVAMIAATVALAWATLGRPTPRQFGLRTTPLGPAIGWTVAAAMTFYVVSGIYGAVLGIESDDDLPGALDPGGSELGLVAVAALVTVGAPIAEELFFRGFLFTALRRRVGLISGALVTGVVFGLVHAGTSEPEFLAPLGLFGFVLCLLYWRTGSLVPCMVLHSVNNSLALGVAQEWTWEIPVVLVASSAFILLVALALARARGLNAPPAPAPAPAG